MGLGVEMAIFWLLSGRSAAALAWAPRPVVVWHAGAGAGALRGGAKGRRGADGAGRAERRRRGAPRRRRRRRGIAGAVSIFFGCFDSVLTGSIGVLFGIFLEVILGI